MKGPFGCQHPLLLKALYLGLWLFPFKKLLGCVGEAVKETLGNNHILVFRCGHYDIVMVYLNVQTVNLYLCHQFQIHITCFKYLGMTVNAKLGRM